MRFLLPLVGAFLLSPLCAAPRPNVVFILVDDMGYSDLGCYGGEIETPNIDSLAATGLRFTQFYNSARCCPTRATLMTGLHPHQVGIGHMTGENANANRSVPPAYAGNINDSCVTLAQVAKSAGYATFMTGKWHLAGKDQGDWPLQRGFDRYYGCIAGATHYFHPSDFRIMYDGNQPDREPKSTTDRPFYTTDAFADHAREFILDHEKGPSKDEPYFLYLAFTAPHWPHHAHDQELKKYQGRYAMGWDKLRQQRFARQKASGLIPASWELTPRDPEVPAWETLDPQKQQECSDRMSAYAAVIDRLDQKIGDVIQTLKDTGEYDNTLLILLSDNGACAEGSVLGLGDPRADRQAGTDLIRPSYGKAWANASATPYRLYKHFAHEGGANTPFIAHWPLHIQPGRDWYREPAQLIDLMATLVDVTGATYPTQFKGHDILPIDGISLTPAFDGKSLARPTPIFIEHENNAFVRDGDWKLVGRNVTPPSGLKPKRWELYHLSEDGTELHNLATDMPERVREMSQAWQQWAQRAQVYPKPKPKP
ncbi:arylsulfatase [Haloferula luteola]|uniref:Arylsulfatase n=1 Tax=Haloferula luteola TaxID=595692 RepID=A0A840V9F3_9BACT|nr:arylsulfatase [Haloferula luteola]MBB5351328.1 arylsulfatase [Haloferula luteola]